MNSKKIHRILWLSVATGVLLLILMCCITALYFDIDPLYELDRPREDALEIQIRALGKQYSCLQFVDGMLIHGKDTHSLAKFKIDQRDATWNMLSNKIYTASEVKSANQMEPLFVLQGRKSTLPNKWIEMLMENKETVNEIFKKDYESIYLLLSSREGTVYLYIEGVNIPGRPDDRNIHFKKRKPKY